MTKEEEMKEVKKILKQQREALVKGYFAKAFHYGLMMERTRRLVELHKTRKR
jgi:hypothetical protein